ISGRRAEPRESIAGRRAFTAGGHECLAEGRGRRRAVAPRLIALAKGHQQVDLPPANEAPALLDVFAVAVERAVVEEVASDELSRFLQEPHRLVRMGRGAGAADKLLEARHVAPADQ